MITKEDIQLVNDRMEIVDIISNFISLKRKGANLTGNCPFHNEKTSSFTVSPSKQIYKCFGCGKSGNAITFVMEHEKFTYPDAIKWIANKIGIEIKETFSSDEERLKQTETENLFLINKFANNYFKDNLKNVPAAQEYITSRGISSESQTIFELGYCGDEYDGLYKSIISSHYNKDVAVKAGLIKQKDNGNFVDSYYTRLIFPIHSLSGKIVAFGGRILTNDSNRPKYINSPENAIYHKSNSLYGLYQARSSITTKNEALLVEGYTDVISFHQSGLTNTIASSGTSLTEQQVRIIKRFTKNIIILYDADNAGYKATVRAIELSASEGMSIRIATLPKGDDPDSFIKKNGRDYVSDYIHTNKVDMVQFFFNTGDPEKRDDTLKDICRIIQTIGKDNYFKKKSYIEKTCKVFGITSKTLSGYFEGEPVLHQEEVVSKEREPMLYSREREVTKLLLKYGDKPYTNDKYVCMEILERVHIEEEEHYSPNHITSLIHTKYNDYIAENEGVLPTINTFIEDENADISLFATSIALEDDMISLSWADSMESSGDDYKLKVKMALGMYELGYYKMMIWVLHNNIGKNHPDWDELTLNRVDQEIRKLARDTAKNLNLSNFKL